MKIWAGNVPPLVRFGALALLPVVVLGFVLARALNSDVQQRYLDSAKQSARLITQVGVPSSPPSRSRWACWPARWRRWTCGSRARQ